MGEETRRSRFTKLLPFLFLAIFAARTRALSQGESKSRPRRCRVSYPRFSLPIDSTSQRWEPGVAIVQLVPTSRARNHRAMT